VKLLFSVVLLLLPLQDSYQEGKAQLDSKNYAEAESAFRQLLDSEAGQASKGYEGLALVEIGRKNYDAALEHAKKSVELNGESADAHYALGLAYAYRQDFKNSAPSLEKSLSLNPDNAYAHYQLGLVQYRLKKYDQTIIHFEKFLEMKPDAPEAPQVKQILKTVRG